VLLVILELYWNLFDWQPRIDSKAMGLVAGLCSAVIAMFLLSQINQGRLSQFVSLLLCLALLALAVYVFPAEPITQGMFGRREASPLWYRAARFVVMVLPLSFWVRGFLRRRKLDSTRAAELNRGKASQLKISPVVGGPPAAS
jgi:hypothetical protein